MLLARGILIEKPVPCQNHPEQKDALIFCIIKRHRQFSASASVRLRESASGGLQSGCGCGRRKQMTICDSFDKIKEETEIESVFGEGAEEVYGKKETGPHGIPVLRGAARGGYTGTVWG